MLACMCVSYVLPRIHREDEIFDLLGLSCLKTSYGVADLHGLASGVFYTPF